MSNQSTNEQSNQRQMTRREFNKFINSNEHEEIVNTAAVASAKDQIQFKVNAELKEEFFTTYFHTAICDKFDNLGGHEDTRKCDCGLDSMWSWFETKLEEARKEGVEEVMNKLAEEYSLRDPEGFNPAVYYDQIKQTYEHN